MGALAAIVIGVLVVAAIAYDVARLITPIESRCPPPARLRGRRAALEEAERWCVGLRLRGRIGQAAYQRRMAALAHGRRRPEPPRGPHSHVTRR
ncbi:hypothetical protein [Streptomyces sp. NPDC048623]|uniref:hypothetical protein n=1 Tax=Streptomyces sp. NPDC048623 TaxID=3155761 RepID=UPI003428AE7D